MKNSVLTFTAAALVSAFAVAPAQAQNLRVEVGYSDLDIHSATGAEALAGRIEAGVGAACARAGDIRALKATALCKQELISVAVAQLNSKGATEAALHLSNKG